MRALIMGAAMQCCGLGLCLGKLCRCVEQCVSAVAILGGRQL